MNSIITTFEIYALDLERAAAFYGVILGRKIEITDIGGEKGGLLSSAGDPVSGIIRCAPEYAKPSDQGSNVYFRIENGLDGVLAKAEKHGGRILVPKTDAGEFGQFAWILDSEGNRIGINQPKK